MLIIFKQHENNYIQNYEIILKHLQDLHVNPNIFLQLRKPKLGNIEVVTLCLKAEYMGVDSECQLFRIIEKTQLEGLIARSVYNKRKQRLFCMVEVVRQKLADCFNQYKDYYIVDSMPIEVCKM